MLRQRRLSRHFSTCGSRDSIGVSSLSQASFVTSFFCVLLRRHVFIWCALLGWLRDHFSFELCHTADECKSFGFPMDLDGAEFVEGVTWWPRFLAPPKGWSWASWRPDEARPFRGHRESPRKLDAGQRLSLQVTVWVPYCDNVLLKLWQSMRALLWDDRAPFRSNFVRERLLRALGNGRGESRWLLEKALEVSSIGAHELKLWTNPRERSRTFEAFGHSIGVVFQTLYDPAKAAQSLEFEAQGSLCDF